MSLDFKEAWIGVDLDGTLSDNRGPVIPQFMIPGPVPAMVVRVKGWLSQGKKVKIFTARMSVNPDLWQKRIGDWTQFFIGQRLEATCIKDFGCIELWDDIAVGVNENKGTPKSEPLHR